MLLFFQLSAFSFECATKFDFPSSDDIIPLNYSGKIFKLRQDYPKKLVKNYDQPWKKVDFKTNPEKYMQVVLDYVLDGNIDVDFVLEENKKRNWYHAPWMNYGIMGREFINGLTREKSAKPFQFHKNQRSKFQNWAIGIINEPGGYVYGQVWCDPENPNPILGVFPEGTVSAKLVFSESTEDQVPWIKKSVEWKANINENAKGTPKRIATLRLIQIDIAVKDSRATNTGWVMGSFIYNYEFSGDCSNESCWYKLQPIGLSWGNDPNYTQKDYTEGKKLTESWINDDVNKSVLGYLGRLNGAIDNKKSSCLSCHSTAQYPKTDSVPVDSEDDVYFWFRNIKGGDSFDNKGVGLDYSKQLAHGIENFYEYKRSKNGKHLPVSTE